MSIITSVPLKFDCELLNDTSKFKASDLKLRYHKEKEAYKDIYEGFLVFGLSKGTVVFIQVDQLETIYARFSIHRQSI